MMEMNNFRFLESGKVRARYSYNFDSETGVKVTMGNIIQQAFNSNDGFAAIKLKRIEFEIFYKEKDSSFITTTEGVSLLVLGRRASIEYTNSVGPDGVYKIPESEIVSN